MFTETPPESNTGLVLHRKDAKNAKKGKKKTVGKAQGEKHAFVASIGYPDTERYGLLSFCCPGFLRDLCVFAVKG